MSKIRAGVNNQNAGSGSMIRKSGARLYTGIISKGKEDKSNEDIIK